MPAPTFAPSDQDQDEKLNPGQQDYNRRIGDVSHAENRGTFDDALKDIDDNYDKTADPSQEDENIRKLREKENNASPPVGDWNNEVKPTNVAKTAAKSWFKRRGPMLGLGGGLGIISVLVTLLPGMTSLMLPNLAQNATINNDVNGSILEKRLVKILGLKMSNTGVCSTKVTCKMNKMPNSMLAAMEEKGIKPKNADGSDYTVKGNGYADTNPAKYEIPDGKGSIKIIDAAKFTEEYADNPTFRKAFKSAYNMRYLGYNSKYMLTNFFDKFKIKRDGGSASAESTMSESTADGELDKLLASEAGDITEDSAKTSFRDRFVKLLDRTAKKTEKAGADPLLTAATLSCTAVSLPTFAADTYRGIQDAQLIFLLSDLVLSASGAQQAGDAAPEKIAAIGSLLTARPKNSDGTYGKSALDSAILLSAIGVNKNPTGVSKYAPGYSLITNPVIQGFSKASKATKSTCNVISSPQAQVVVDAVEAGVGTASLGVGDALIAVLKVAGKGLVAIGGVDAGMKLVEQSGILDTLASSAYSVVKDLVGNYVTGAKYEQLGDALGTAIYTFYPTAGLASGAAVLKTSQVADFSNVMVAAKNETRDEDIATLSPFDTSSQYTFLGSILSNYAMANLASDNPFQSALSTLGYIVQSPLRLFSNTSSADVSTAQQNCSYASSFGIDDDIAMNAAGYPCVGIPSSYLDMSPEDVYNTVSDDIDPDTGEIKDGSDTSQMMADCSEGSLESVSGCTIDKSSAGSGSFDEKKRAAESLYMYDSQVTDILDGSSDTGN